MANQKEVQSLFEEIKSDYLIFFENWLAGSGINPFIGRVMQILRSENKFMTQRDITSLSKLSKSTVSKTLHLMEDMNLIKKDVILPYDKANKYQYELKDNSLIYIIISFLRKNYDLFKQRTEDNKLLLMKMQDLPKDEREKEEFKNFFRIIEEEVVVFDIIKEKFEDILQLLENEMLKSKKNPLES